MKLKCYRSGFLSVLFLFLSSLKVYAAGEFDSSFISGTFKSGLQGITGIFDAFFTVLGDNPTTILKLSLAVVLTILYYAVFKQVLKKNENYGETGSSKPAWIISIITAILSVIFIPESVLLVYKDIFMIATSLLLIALHAFAITKWMKEKTRFNYFVKLLISAVAIILIGKILTSEIGAAMKAIAGYYLIFLIFAMLYYLIKLIVPGGEVTVNAGNIAQGAAKAIYSGAKAVNQFVEERDLIDGISKELNNFDAQTAKEEQNITNFINSLKNILPQLVNTAIAPQRRAEIINLLRQKITYLKVYISDPKTVKRIDELTKEIGILEDSAQKKTLATQNQFEKTQEAIKKIKNDLSNSILNEYKKNLDNAVNNININLGNNRKVLRNAVIFIKTYNRVAVGQINGVETIINSTLQENRPLTTEESVQTIKYLSNVLRLLDEKRKNFESLSTNLKSLKDSENLLISVIQKGEQEMSKLIEAFNINQKKSKSSFKRKEGKVTPSSKKDNSERSPFWTSPYSK